MKVKGIVISILIAIFGISTMPFSIVHADTISSSNIEGVNVQLVDVTEISVDNTNLPNNLKRYNWTFKYEVVFDKEYFGYMTGKFTSSFYANDINGQSQQYDIDTGNKSYYICGQSFTYYTQIQVWYSSVVSGAFQNLYSGTFTLAGSNVVEFGLLETIEDIQSFISSIDTDITQYFYDSTNGSVIEVLIDEYSMLSNILQQISSIGENVEYISRLRQYNVPIYSWNIVYKCLQEFEIYDQESQEGRQLILFDYPAFIIPPGYSNNTFMAMPVDRTNKNYLIYGISGNRNYNNDIVTIDNPNNRLVFENRSTLFKEDTGIQPFGLLAFNKLIFNRTDGTSSWINLKINNNTQNDILFIPIMYYSSQNHYFDLDFALRWGLSNPIIDNLELLTNGDQDLETSILYDLNPSVDDMNDNFDDMFTIEDQYNEDLNDQIDNIDFSNPLQNNQSLLSSGNFVIQVFNGLIANNPISILIIISCILLVARRLFG